MPVDQLLFKKILSEAKVIYLATSKNNLVTNRPVGFVNIGLTLYIRTEEDSRKVIQMKANPNVAACVDNFYFEGTVRLLGAPDDPANSAIKRKYIERYPVAFTEADTLSGKEIFVAIDITVLYQWVFKNGVPVGLVEERLS